MSGMGILLLYSTGQLAEYVQTERIHCNMARLCIASYHHSDFLVLDMIFEMNGKYSTMGAFKHWTHILLELNLVLSAITSPIHAVQDRCDLNTDIIDQL